MIDGRVAFTRMRLGLSPLDKASVSRATPDLAAPYGPNPDPAGSADAAPTKMI